MAVQWHPLPLEVFPPEARPFVARLNRDLRDVFGLEGMLKSPRSSRRSDRSVARRQNPQVDVSRVSPTISTVVAGSSTVVGLPNLTLGTVNVKGTTTTALSVNSSLALFGTQLPAGLSLTAAVGSSAFAARADHRHQISDTLLSVANATMVLSDTGGAQALTGSSGSLSLSQPGGWIFLKQASGGPNTQISVQMDPGAGNTIAIDSNTFGGYVGTGLTIRPWRATYSSHAGVFTSMTFVGYDADLFSFQPTAGSSGGNVAYTSRLQGPVINNNTGSWSDVATLTLLAPRRVLNNPVLTQCNTVALECPVIGSTTQAGLYIRQRAAQQVAANRYGILIDAQNSGTNRYCLYGASDIAYLGGTLQHTGKAWGIFGATPSTQYGTTGTLSGFAAGTSTTVTADSTFTGNTGSTGYTIGDLVLALKRLGELVY